MSVAIIMNESDAITALLEKVINGSALHRDFCNTWPNARSFEHHYAFEAYGGDLNCCIPLQDHLLGAGYYLSGLHELRDMYSVRIIPGDHIGRDTCAARAWLIAIMKARLAKLEDAR